jgi:hypothetical protein
MTARADDDCFFDVDMTDYPLYNIHIRRQPRSDEEIDRLQKRFVAILEVAAHGTEATAHSPAIPPEKIFLVMTLDGLMKATADQMMRAHGLITAVKELAPKAIHGTALVATNPDAYQIVSGILMLAPLQSTHKMFPDHASADRWIKGMMVEKGVFV